MHFSNHRNHQRSTMTSPRSDKGKEELKKIETPFAFLFPASEASKKCKLKDVVKRMARIQTGVKAPRGPIASHHPHQDATPLRRSTRLLGMKRKDYREKTPEPQDIYGDSDYSDDRSAASWGNGKDDNDLYYWEEFPREEK